jgi:hypothetical protein
MLAGAAAALHTVAGARIPTVASDSAAAASAAGRFDGKQTSKTETSSNPYFLFACLPDSWLFVQFVHTVTYFRTN